MRTLVYALGFIMTANALVLAQQSDLALSSSLPRGSHSVGSALTTEHKDVHAVMPAVKYYSIAEGEDEDFPPGLYATFLPSVPDTVEAFDDLTGSCVTIHTRAGKEIIHGDSTAVLHEVKVRTDLYAGIGTLPGKLTSFVSRSGFVPISQFGSNRTRFAIKPSHFRITPGATISASVQIEGDEDLRAPLCMVSNIDYEHNTFTVEISKEVSVGETLNWVIINFPE